MPFVSDPVASAPRRPSALVAITCLLALSLAPAPIVHAQGGAAPDEAAGRLVILSTTDVKGKTGPCGCHVPKGGLSRRVAFADSMRVQYPFLLIVDSGGFFPEERDHQPAAQFLSAAMQTLGVHAAGLGDRDLGYGRAFLLETVSRTKLPVVCANLWDKQTGKNLVRPSLIQKVGPWKVGVFGLMSAEVPLGPAKDSLSTSDPAEAARQAIKDLRRQGATVIVLLSTMGKVATEDLVTAVDGIDVAIAGRNVPVLESGRIVKKTMVVYGGEQSQYMGRTELALDSRGHVVGATARTNMLGPEVGENAAMLASVKAFEDALSTGLHRLEKERAAGDAPRSESASH